MAASGHHLNAPGASAAVQYQHEQAVTNKNSKKEKRKKEREAKKANGKFSISSIHS